MPSAEIWSLFPALGAVVLLLVIIGMGARAMWREYRAYMEIQDTKRDAERTKQRQWEEEQDAIRDDRWQTFVQNMQIAQAEDSAKDRKTISDLAAVIEGMQKAVETLTETFKNHILEDSARFDVLLNPEQKKAVEDVKTQPRKKPNGL